MHEVLSAACKTTEAPNSQIIPATQDILWFHVAASVDVPPARRRYVLVGSIGWGAGAIRVLPTSLYPLFDGRSTSRRRK